MKGLILKDLLVVRKPMKTYLLLLLFYFLLTLAGLFPLSICLATGQVVVMMLPIATFSYDEQARWDRFAGVLPTGRVKQVQARYLFTIFVFLGVTLYNLMLSVLLLIVRKEPLLDSAMSLLGATAAGLLIVNLMLPLCYQMGPERARPYLYAVVFIPVLLAMGMHKLGILGGALSSFSEQGLSLFLLGLVLLMVGGFVVSLLISCRIMRWKEL